MSNFLTGLGGAVAVMICAQAMPAAAQTVTYQLDIPAQDLGPALKAFARAARLPVTFDSAAVRGKRSPALRGRYSATAALDALLAGSGLSYERGDSGLYMVRASGPSATVKPFESGLVNAADDDIVVTARKREERAIDIPIAITAVRGRDLERRGVKNLADFLQEAPGVGIYDSGSGTQKITIRGISTSLGANENGYYLDDLPFNGVTVPIAPDIRAWDLDRVEVLRGPQGTLFGEGSMGGTVRILTQGADLANWEAKGYGFVSGTDGGGTNGGLKGAFNAPIIKDVLAVRVSGTHERYEGWIDDRATGRANLNDQTYDTFRARARFDPTDRLSISGSYIYYKGDFPNGGSTATDDNQLSQSGVLGSMTKYKLYGASARYDLGRAQLFYGYSRNQLTFAQSGDFLGGVLNSTIGIKVDAHEARLASSGSGPLQYTIGVYQRTSRRDDVFEFALFGIDNSGVVRSTARAAFGEATYTLPGIPIDLTAGLRYFEDNLRGVEFNAGVPTPQPGGKYHSTNPRLSIAWHPQPNVNIYASAAKGFRSGQLQPTTSVALAQLIGLDLPTALRQDSIWTYEVGAKADLFGRKLSIEAAAYHSKWDDVTVRIPIATTGFNGLINSDGTKTWGGELSVVARPLPGLILTATGSYVDATFAGSVAGTGILDGAPVDEIAKFTTNASADYTREIANGVKGMARVSWQHNSPRRFDSFPLFRPGDSINRVDVRLGVDLDQLTLAVFAENLTNDQGAVTYRSVQPIAPGVDDVISTRLRPRTIGVEASFRFGGPR